jgi:hypothetical protein
MGKRAKQFAGFGVVGTGGVLFDGEISNMDRFLVLLNVRPPIRVARKKVDALVLGRSLLSHFPHVLLILCVCAYPQIRLHTIQPVKIPMVNVDVGIRNAFDKTMEQNRALTLVSSGTVNRTPMDKSVPRTLSNDPLIIRIVNQRNIAFCEWNFLHNPAIIPQLVKRSNA